MNSKKMPVTVKEAATLCLWMSTVVKRDVSPSIELAELIAAYRVTLEMMQHEARYPIRVIELAAAAWGMVVFGTGIGWLTDDDANHLQELIEQMRTETLRHLPVEPMDCASTASIH